MGKRNQISTPIDPERLAKRASLYKPEKFQDYLTIGELSLRVGRGRLWLRKLERDGRIPKAKRHKTGQIEIRLYSPSQVEEIEQILSTMRPGQKRVSNG